MKSADGKRIRRPASYYDASGDLRWVVAQHIGVMRTWSARGTFGSGGNRCSSSQCCRLAKPGAVTLHSWM